MLFARVRSEASGLDSGDSGAREARVGTGAAAVGENSVVEITFEAPATAALGLYSIV